MKKLKRGMAFVLTLCMIFSIFTNVSVAQAATKKNVAKTVTVKTQKELEKALKDGKATKIKIVTSKKINLVIPKGKKTAGIQLVVNAPKATIVNKATFKKISITGSGAKSYTESGKNNVLVVSADSAKVTVAKNASVKTLTMDGAKATVVVNSGSKVAKVVVAEDQCNVSLKVNGTVSAVKVTGDASKISISGKASDTPVTVTGDQASVAASTSVKLDIQSDAKITLKDGAEGSSVKASDDVVIKVDNKTEEKVTVTTPSGKTEVGAGETVKDVVAQEKPEEDKKPEETKKPEGGNAGGSGSVSSGDSGNTGNNSGDNSSEEEKELSYDGYTLKWEDEFNGTELNRKDWNVELHEPGWVNAELQEYVDSDENIQVKGGQLHIKPVKAEVETEGSTFDPKQNLLPETAFGNGTLTIEVTDVKTNPWDIQELQAGIALKDGATYKLSFKASSTVARTIVAGVQKTSADYDQYGQLITEITTEPTEYVTEFTMKTSDTNAGVYFNFGNAGKDSTGKEIETPVSTVTITDVKLVQTGAPAKTYKYTSGRVNTQKKQDFKYGLFEAKVKVPTGMGYLPAFWMMPTDENLYGQWPRCGEIDIMEVMGQDTKKAMGTIHYGNPHGQKQGDYTLSSGDFSSQWHTFSLEWEPGKLVWYVDGIKYHEANDWYTTTEGQGTVAYPAPFDQKFYMILNLAIGGSWVGYPDETTTYDDQEFAIDYVRAYQKSEDYYEKLENSVEKPVKPEVVEPGKDNEYIKNGAFSTADDLTGENGSVWEFMTQQGGEAEAVVVSDEKFGTGAKAVKFSTTKAGTENYSVQFVQANIPVKQGGIYKVIFDAYAADDREMIVDVSAPDYNYARYLGDTSVKLTTEKKTYSYEFTVKDHDDANARLEFNFGKTDKIADVFISNVKMTKIGEEAIDTSKKVLTDGNYVSNGKFQEGIEAGKKYMQDWSITGTTDYSVTKIEDGRRLKVTSDAANKVVIKQSGLPLTAGKYELSFDAEVKGNDTATIDVVVAGKKLDTVTVTSKSAIRKLELTAEDVAEGKNKDIVFECSVNGTLYLDNIRLVEDTLIKNGSFNAGLAGYDVYAYTPSNVSYVVDSQSEKNACDITIKDTGDQDWHIQLKQSNVTLEKDQWYNLKFDIKSSKDRKVSYAIQRNGAVHEDASGKEDWTPYVQKVIDITGEYQTVSTDFKMAYDTDDGSIFNIAMGAVGGTQITEQHRICIDNIVLEKIDEPEIEEKPQGVNLLKDPQVTDDSVWDTKGIWADGAAEVKKENHSVIFDITNVGTEDSAVSLKQHGLTLEAGASYMLTFDAVSTETRKIKPCFMTEAYAWYGGTEVELTKDVVKNVSFEFTVGNDGAGNPLPTADNIVFQISLGKIGDTTPTSTVTLSNFSLVKKTAESANN